MLGSAFRQVNDLRSVKFCKVSNSNAPVDQEIRLPPGHEKSGLRHPNFFDNAAELAALRTDRRFLHGSANSWYVG